jgi:hypothetical protein
MQSPSVGRIVHLIHKFDDMCEWPLAAIVTGTYPSTFEIDLTYFSPHQEFSTSIRQVPWSELYKAGHWSWPPRVE